MYKRHTPDLGDNVIIDHPSFGTIRGYVTGGAWGDDGQPEALTIRTPTGDVSYIPSDGVQLFVEVRRIPRVLRARVHEGQLQRYAQDDCRDGLRRRAARHLADRRP